MVCLHLIRVDNYIRSNRRSKEQLRLGACLDVRFGECRASVWHRIIWFPVQNFRFFVCSFFVSATETLSAHKPSTFPVVIRMRFAQTVTHSFALLCAAKTTNIFWNVLRIPCGEVRTWKSKPNGRATFATIVLARIGMPENDTFSENDTRRRKTEANVFRYHFVSFSVHWKHHVWHRIHTKHETAHTLLPLLITIYIKIHFNVLMPFHRSAVETLNHFSFYGLSVVFQCMSAGDVCPPGGSQVI